MQVREADSDSHPSSTHPTQAYISENFQTTCPIQRENNYLRGTIYFYTYAGRLVIFNFIFSDLR